MGQLQDRINSYNTHIENEQIMSGHTADQSEPV